MTDQIYYKIQYPLKKAITKIKNIDTEDPFVGEDYSRIEKDKIKDFLEKWENEGKDNLKALIQRLRKSK